MRRIDWIWIFFVIIAVGLVLSWGRTGQRLHEAQEVGLTLDVDRVLEAESPCQPLLAPCAALGREVAVVLGPVADQPDLLALRLVSGETLPAEVDWQIDWQGEGDGFSPQLSLSLRRVQADQWLIALPADTASSQPALWVRFELEGIRYSVRFPLR